MKNKKSLLLLSLLLVLGGCKNDESSSRPFVGKTDGIVTLYSINDFHGKVAQDDSYNGILAVQGAILSDLYYESSALILSAGDMWQGSYVSGYDKGKSITELMNAFPFSAMALGNHEFDWGVEQIQKNQEVSDFPFLCANLVEEESGKRPSWIKDHVVLEAEGHKIGIVGAIGAALEGDIKASALEGYEFSSDLDILSESYTACVQEGAEVVLLSLHDDQDSGYTNSIQESDIGFMGIFGGHSHQFQNEKDEKVPYVQGGSDSRGYSYMRIDLNQKELLSIRYEDVERSDLDLADSGFAKTVAKLLEERQAQPIGYLEGKWTKSKSGNLVVKAMFDMARKYYPEKNYDETNLLAIHNTGGVRGSFPESDASLEITMADIQIVSPFDNTVVILPQRKVSSGGLTKTYTYPYDNLGFVGKTIDLVVIDYLLDNTSGMFSKDGALPLEGEGKEAIIYDVVAEYIQENSSKDNPLRAEDF